MIMAVDVMEAEEPAFYAQDHEIGVRYAIYDELSAVTMSLRLGDPENVENLGSDHLLTRAQEYEDASQVRQGIMQYNADTFTDRNRIEDVVRIGVQRGP